MWDPIETGTPRRRHRRRRHLDGLRSLGHPPGRRGGLLRLPPHRGGDGRAARKSAATPRKRACSSTSRRRPCASWRAGTTAHPGRPLPEDRARRARRVRPTQARSPSSAPSSRSRPTPSSSPSATTSRSSSTRRRPTSKRQTGARSATDEDGRTSLHGVFAAGDNVRGADLVVTALAAAKRAAAAMDEYLPAALAEELTSQTALL